MHAGTPFAAVELEHATKNKEYYSYAANPPCCGYCCCEARHNQEYGSNNVADNGKSFHMFSLIRC